MYHAKENIRKNDVICFSNGIAFPLKSQKSFLESPGIIENASQDYKKGDQVQFSNVQQDPVSAEAKNIKKLSRILPRATGANQKIISSLIIKKLSALKVFNEIQKN